MHFVQLKTIPVTRTFPNIFGSVCFTFCLRLRFRFPFLFLFLFPFPFPFVFVFVSVSVFVFVYPSNTIFYMTVFSNKSHAIRESNANSIIKFLLPAFGRARVSKIFTLSFCPTCNVSLSCVCLPACLINNLQHFLALSFPEHPLHPIRFFILATPFPFHFPCLFIWLLS